MTKATKQDSLNQKAWLKILAQHPEANFLQTPEWAAVNSQMGHTVVPLISQTGVALTIIKDARRGRYLEIPGGPLLDWDNRQLVDSCFAEVIKIAKAHKCVFIRFRPQLPKTPENMALMQQLGARPASFHLHAEHTVMIDLTKSEDELLANMRRQTRYEVRRSIKQKIKVTKGSAPELFRTFYQIQTKTAARQHFIPPSQKDLMTYHKVFGKNAKIYTSWTPDGEMIALGLILISGKEADYFEAASTDLNRRLPGAYALLWQAMKDLKKQGVERFNLWGIAPPGQPNHRYAGVTTFKTGFGGEVTEFVPAHDIIIRRGAYLGTRLIETIRKKMRRL